MSYEIHPGERLSHALERAARAELRKGRKAVKQPVPPGDAAEHAHALRVATKKVRAVARLVEPGVGRKARQANRDIGACADVVAPLRDADAALRTFEKLRAALPVRMRPTTDVTRVALTERLRHERERAERVGTLEKLVRALRREQRRVPRWTPNSDRWKAVAPGLAEAYRRARTAMQRAYRQPTGETFHAWRRAVKAHRYQVRLLSPLWPRELNARADRLATLAEYLGDEHDLTMLRRTLRANRFWFGDDGETYYEVLRRIDRQRREKRLQARPLGEELFGERPRALVGRMRQGFRDFRRKPTPAKAAA